MTQDKIDSYKNQISLLRRRAADYREIDFDMSATILEKAADSIDELVQFAETIMALEAAPDSTQDS